MLMLNKMSAYIMNKFIYVRHLTCEHTVC